MRFMQLGPRAPPLNSSRRRPTLALSFLEGFDEQDEQSLGTGAVELPILCDTTAPPMLPGRIESQSFSSSTRSQAPIRQFELLTWINSRQVCCDRCTVSDDAWR